MKILKHREGNILGRSVEIDGVRIGIITAFGETLADGCYPKITLEVITDEELMKDLADYLYMASIVDGGE